MDNSPEGSAMHDMYYYAGREVKEKEADFRIEQYDMDLQIRNQLKSVVKMRLSDPELQRI